MKEISALENLGANLKWERRYLPIPFEEFLDIVSKNPKTTFRDIFQLFYDMMHFYVPEGTEEYPNDPENIGYRKYDFSKLLEESDNPFFADRLLANRLMNLVSGFREGSPSHKIILFEGPPGSGKSIFLTNLLNRLVDYTHLPEGELYETVWRLDGESGFGGGKLGFDTGCTEKETNSPDNSDEYFDIPCPSHDHPILQIPKSHRRKFLEDLITDKPAREKLFHEKEFEWVFEREPCSICSSIYQRLFAKLKSSSKVLRMIYPRRYSFNKNLGEGISIFNSADPIGRGENTNEFLQKRLDTFFKDSNAVQFIFSDLARTNNGVFALMDIKDENRKRLLDLHGIVSDGVHKVQNVEESIRSLFIGSMNPEDAKLYEGIPSFKDRVVKVKVPYVLDYSTEVKIYEKQFASNLRSYFLPGVLENFARIIISTRFNKDSEAIDKWISHKKVYKKFLDEGGLLLKMEIYGGNIPLWLTEEDRRNFDNKTRKEIIAESELDKEGVPAEGMKGLSGRESIRVLNYFLSLHHKKDRLITMEDVYSFFNEKSGEFDIPLFEDFLDSVKSFYDFTIAQEIKDSIYNYNSVQITKDIQNYLYAINFNPGNEVKVHCPFTQEVVEVTDDYLGNIEIVLIGSCSSENRLGFRESMRRDYVSKTLTKEMGIQGKSITETEQYSFLFKKYTQNGKENALLPMKENENFKKAILDFKEEAFNKYDRKLRTEVTSLLANLQTKFGYTEEGARQICLYAIENNLT